MGEAEDKLICRCFRVPERAIRSAAAEHGLRLVEEVTAVTRAAGGCGSCYDDVQSLLDAIWGRRPSRHAPDASGASDAQRRGAVVECVEGALRRLLELNGLDLRVVEVEGDRVLARYQGDLAGTTAASFLAIKRHVVERISAACGRDMKLVELNVLEGLAKTAKA